MGGDGEKMGANRQDIGGIEEGWVGMRERWRRDG